MGIRGRAAAVVASGALLALGCSTALVALSPEKREHDRTAAELGRRAEVEDGWIVLELPNLHEGGGITTWWLHPCDPAADVQRDVTRTAYHGSDVADLTGVHQVEDTTIDCAPPDVDLRLDGGRHLRLDRPVVQLTPSIWAPLEPTDSIGITDLHHDTHHVLEPLAGNATYGPCDGASTWHARLLSPRELVLAADRCSGTLAALPDAARALLDLPTDQHHGQPDTPLPADRVAAFDRALRGAGWDAEEVEFRDFDGTTLTPVWYGPCRPAFEGSGPVRTLADWHADHLETTELPCD